MFRNLLVLVLLLAFSAHSLADKLKKYEDEHLFLFYPDSFSVSYEVDKDGFKEIFVDGPNRTSVFITVTPYPVELPLPDLAENISRVMLEEYSRIEVLEKETRKTITPIDGRMVPGIINIYKTDGFYKVNTVRTTLYLIHARDRSFIVIEERSNREIEADRNMVEKILDSIRIKKLNLDPVKVGG
ncbi:hypothetical protein [Microbulbifer sp. PAAF003]|uniref:hypothetical protein n=1 Tax=Microbulbifer sp. PAAF003 TaxID=3243375 RepID=UPI0040392087